MYQDEDEFILRCDCGDPSHPVHLSFGKETLGLPDIDYLAISLQIRNVDLWQRVKNALLYIFKQRRFWHYGDIVINLKDEHK